MELIRANQSGAILYLCANLHVTEAQSQKDAIYNNDKVNWVNEMISQLADGERCIYIDINEVFDDETGSILYLDDETYGPDQSRYVEQEDQHLMMEGFVESFLRPLNLTAGQLTDNPAFPVDVNAYAQDLSGNVTYAAYTFESAEYKPIHVVFQISPTGFCVNCPTD